jgi:hypothetical protein
MAVSSTNSFILDINEIVEEAMERVGGDPTTGHDMKSARRKLDLVFQDIANRYVPMWLLDEQSQATTQGTASYTLNAATVDVLDVYLQRDSLDTVMQRLSRSEYASLTDKSQQGRPNSYFLDRQRAAPVLYVYLAPENSTDAIRYWRVRRPYDTGNFTNDPDAPTRMLPAVISGLAYYMAWARVDVPGDRLALLKGRWDEDLRIAMQADRDRSSLYLRPRRR